MKRPLEEGDDDCTKNSFVFLDIAVGEEKAGRVVIELFNDTVPRTAENFRALCTGEKGIGSSGKKLHYKGTIFHRMVPKVMLQGGDILNFNGTSGESIYGMHFEDENFELEHDTPGLLSMVNEGRPNTNSSQFIITTTVCKHLNKTNVVFGKVRKGMDMITHLNDAIEVTLKDEPVEKIHVTDCGELKRGENWGLEENDGTADVYPEWPMDWDCPVRTRTLQKSYAIDVIEKIKDSGNQYFAKRDYVNARRKYKKALRYHKWMANSVKDDTDAFRKVVINLKIVTLLNLAAAYLKKKQYREALGTCNQVLFHDKKNSKALFRRAQAHVGINEYELGMIDLENARCSSPNNKDILKEIERLKKIMQTYLLFERAVCKRMFQ